MAGQVWVTDSLGGFMSARNLSKELRMAVQPLCKFRQFCDLKDAIGKNRGNIFTWNVYSDVATAGTVLTETTTIPQTNYTIRQGTMTITEYGNSVPYTGKLDNLSEHPVRELINKVLKNDAKKALDGAAAAQFATTPLVVYPTGGTSTTGVSLATTGTASGTNTGVALNKNHVKAIVDTMKERNIPTYMADDYFAIAHPTTWRQLKNDLESVHQYVDKGFQMILAGEIGRYEGVRFVEQNNVAKDSWGGTATNWAYFFGDDVVAEGVAVPEEVRGKIPDDFGRGRGVAWYYLGGFALVHGGAGNANARVVKWGST